MGRILVVDDEPDVIDVVSARLRAAGHEVVAAAGGTQAIEAIGKRALDLMILDLLMPGVDGIGVLTQLRRNGRPRLPVLLLTAHGYPGTPEALMPLGCHDLLVKPFRAQDLLDKVNRLLGREPCGRGQPPTILLLDQDPEFRRTAGERLARMGYAVESVGEIGKAFERAHIVRPDLVLLDLDLSEINGLHAHLPPGHDWSAKAAPVIALTSRTHPVPVEEAWRLGADALITKPLDWDDLRDRIASCLSKTCGPPAAALSR